MGERVRERDAAVALEAWLACCVRVCVCIVLIFVFFCALFTCCTRLAGAYSTLEMEIALTGTGKFCKFRSHMEEQLLPAPTCLHTPVCAWQVNSLKVNYLVY